MTATTIDIAALGQTPVSTDSPVGTPLREDPDFDAIQNELRKLDSLTGASPDWRRVVELATQILDTKSKDLRVGCYCAIGLLATRGLKGFTEGLALLGGLVAEFWGEFYPPVKRMNGRIQALEWLGARSLALIEQMSQSDSDPRVVTAAAGETRRLAELLASRLATAGDSAQEIQGRLHRVADAIERRTAPRPRPVATIASTASTPTIETPEQARAALASMKCDLLQIASQLLAGDARDALSYRLSRVVLWTEATRIAIDDEQMLSLPGPDPTEAESILSSLRAHTDPGGLCLIEQAIRKNPYWLDLQHLSWSLLHSLGSEYSSASETVLEDVLSLVRRRPELPGCKFGTGHTLASDQTRAWLEQSNHSTLHTEPTKPDPGDQDSHIAETVVAAARSRAARGDVRGGLRLFEESLLRCNGLRDRFQQRLLLACFAASNKHPEIALAQFDILDEEIQRFGIDEWEPALAARAITEQLKVLGGLPAKKLEQLGDDPAQRLANCRRRLYRLAPGAALDLNGRAKK